MQLFMFGKGDLLILLAAFMSFLFSVVVVVRNWNVCQQQRGLTFLLFFTLLLLAGGLAFAVHEMREAAHQDSQERLGSDSKHSASELHRGGPPGE